MKAITLTQPWASLVALGAKRIETRSWRTAYRGSLAIHAAKGFPRWAKETCNEPPRRERSGSPRGAFVEVTRFVVDGLKSVGEQWNDQAKQDAICSVLISASRQGLLTLWEREAER